MLLSRIVKDDISETARINDCIYLRLRKEQEAINGFIFIVSSRLALAGLRRPVYSSIAYKHKRTATLVADPRQFRFSFFLRAVWSGSESHAALCLLPRWIMLPVAEVD